MLPITAIICTKNEIVNLPHSLPPLQKHFNEVLIIDSYSTDGTQKYATHQFEWNGQYPKKRQWILDNISTKHDWVFMIDADEIVTSDFINDLKKCDFSSDGYFVSSYMTWKNKKPQYGLKNNKLYLFHKLKFKFPIISDLDIEGMGEMEGHYQPIPIKNVRIGKIKSSIIHHDSKDSWHDRHDKYIQWEIGMNKHNAWPKDPLPSRELLKSKLRTSYARPFAISIYGYFIKLGFLDGYAGLNYTFNRARYAFQIVHETQNKQRHL